MIDLFQLNSVGLLYDGAGIVALGSAFFAKSYGDVIEECATYPGGNGPQMRALIEQRTDGRAGTAFLLVGFILQFVGSFPVHEDTIGSILICVLAITALSYLIFLRKMLVDHHFRSLMDTARNATRRNDVTY